MKSQDSTNISEKYSEEEKNYNRKSVDTIKRLIITALLVMFVLPILFSLYVMVRVNSLERRMDTLINNLNKESVKQEISTQEDAARKEIPSIKGELDEFSVEDIDKTKSENDDILANAYSSEQELIEISDVSSVKPNGKKVYLTFDDGPSHATDEILDILNRENVKATFFVVHNPDEELWDEYSKIVEQGHTLGMHSYTHVYDEIYASKEAFVNDVTMLHDFLYEQTGVDCKYYRFPGGSSNTVSSVPVQELIGYLCEQGITYYDWNALNGDAVSENTTPEELNETLLGYVRANEGDSMVLMHDLENVHATVDSLEELIHTLKEEGYEICPIDDSTAPVQHVSYDYTCE